MKLIRRNILYSDHLLLDFSLAEFIIVLSDYFCFHVLFLLFFCEASPVELSITADVLLTFLDIGEVHGNIFLGVLKFLLFIRLLLLTILFILLYVVLEVI